MSTEDNAVLPARRLLPVAIAGVLSAGIRGAHDNHRLGSLFVDPYWVGFYVTNYQDGFRRRALIGTLCRLVQPAGISVVLINVFAVLAMLGVLALLIYAFLRLASAPVRNAPTFLFALFASAIGSVYFEVLGDTLQIAIMVFALFALLPALLVSSLLLRVALSFLGLLLAFFVHEGSVFLLAACIPFLVRDQVRLRDFALPAAVLVLLAGLSFHWSVLHTHLTYHAVSIPKGMPLEDLAVTPGFAALLRIEQADDFGSSTKILFFLVKCASIAGLGLATLVAAANSLSQHMLQRYITSFVVVLCSSAPLWFIAHDWGRFLAYTVLLAAVSASAWPRLQMHVAPRFFTRLTAWVTTIGGIDAFRCGALLLLLASPYYQSRIFGMHIRDLLSSLPVLAVGLFVLRSSRSTEGGPPTTLRQQAVLISSKEL